MDISHVSLRSVNSRVLQKKGNKLGLDSRKLPKRKKPKASLKSRKKREKDCIPKRVVKEDAMETTVLIIFWGVIIVVAELVKWVAAFHFAKHLPWIKAFMGGTH